MIPPSTASPPSAATTADMPNLVALEGGCSALDATGTGRGVLDLGVDGLVDGAAELFWVGGTAFTGGAAMGAGWAAGGAGAAAAAISTSVHE